MQINAAIFDLDGTVLSNEIAYAQAFKKILAEIGINQTEDYPQIGGVGVEKNWEYFINKFNIQTNKTLDELSQLTQQAYLEEMSEVHLRPGFLELIDALKNANIKTALATSNNKDITRNILSKFNLQASFDIVVTVDDVKNPKPDPEVFKKASDLLGENPLQCVVFEDAQSGIDAAKILGMKVIAVKNVTQSEIHGYDLLITDFTQLDADNLLEVLSK